MFNTGRYFCLLLVAFALTFLFWWPLFFGYGFIGGDLYPYFFPQKVFYADCLRAGELPLWNDLTGFGYPILGESQTGAAYPLHVVLYGLLSVNTAYNVQHLLHYLICFVATALFALRVGNSGRGAMLTGLVFTFGWFPPRSCLEWAILTGCWLPVAMYCVESFLQTRLWRYSIGLSIALGLQLLAGHYHLAFITQLMVASYATWRLWAEHSQQVQVHPGTEQGRVSRGALALILAGIAGVCLAGVQLVPSWELKQRSSRVVAGSDYDPAYGHMPPLYVTQLIAPWCWYSPQAIGEDNLVRTLAELVAPWQLFGPNHELDEAIRQARLAALETGTNKVEAHVYCGLVPLLLAAFAVIRWARHRRSSNNAQANASVLNGTTGYWLMVGTVALIYATGWLLPIGKHLPGFSFFRGPGRYGIVTTFAIALLAGQMLSHLQRCAWPMTARGIVIGAIFASTTGDLWMVSRMVTYTAIVSKPAISFREDSPVRKLLAGEKELPRLVSPGPNVGTLLGVSCVPWYLGIAPAEYVDSQFAMPDSPKPLPSGRPTPASTPYLEWLSQAGVTHVLNFEPLDEQGWGVELLWKGVDPFLNRIWGRMEPIHLYRFKQREAGGDAVSYPGRARIGANGVSVSNRPESPWGRGTRKVVVEQAPKPDEPLILTELAYPGWTVEKNGIPTEARQIGQFRAVDAPAKGDIVVWRYRPLSVIIGAIVSLFTAFLLAAVAHVRFWHTGLTDRFLRWACSAGDGVPGSENRA
ncbi:hypothetical protein [Schlesneria sp. T3-172]|uniref:hypothetical protein n=1 Tax=Schlesneria sphaerica TaxID=3373610 RepID=UPI0037CBB41A